ncbi:MAG: hypothetical protein IBJ07_06075 [Rhizobiaceae bacterium]|nr:hypothetical protein [Rhizobiaceae bacterium]
MTMGLGSITQLVRSVLDRLRQPRYRPELHYLRGLPSGLARSRPLRPKRKTKR